MSFRQKFDLVSILQKWEEYKSHFGKKIIIILDADYYEL